MSTNCKFYEYLIPTDCGVESHPNLCTFLFCSIFIILCILLTMVKCQIELFFAKRKMRVFMMQYSNG